MPYMNSLIDSNTPSLASFCAMVMISCHAALLPTLSVRGVPRRPCSNMWQPHSAGSSRDKAEAYLWVVEMVYGMGKKVSVSEYKKEKQIHEEKRQSVYIEKYTHVRCSFYAPVEMQHKQVVSRCVEQKAKEFQH